MNIDLSLSYFIFPFSLLFFSFVTLFKLKLFVFYLHAFHNQFTCTVCLLLNLENPIILRLLGHGSLIFHSADEDEDVRELDNKNFHIMPRKHPERNIRVTRKGIKI